MLTRNDIELFDLYRYINETFDPVIVAGDGEELRVDCFAPMGCRGTDTGQHLYINTDKKSWFCFKCGYGSHDQQLYSNRLYRFIADAERITTQEAIDKITGQTKPTPEDELRDLLEQAFSKEDSEKEDELLEINLPKQFFKLWESVYPSIPYQKYIKSRGLETEDLKKYNIRYCFSQKFKLWSKRVIFPVYDQLGICRSAVGRLISEDNTRTSWANWPKSNVSNLLWPLGHYNRKWKWNPAQIASHVILTEGVFDCLAVNKLTQYQALCTFGKKISTAQVKMLRDADVKSITLAWDRDAREQIWKSTRRLSKYFDVYVFPFVSDIWNAHDFGDVLKSQNPSWKQLLEQELDNSISIESTEFISWAI